MAEIIRLNKIIRYIILLRGKTKKLNRKKRNEIKG